VAAGAAGCNSYPGEPLKSKKATHSVGGLFGFMESPLGMTEKSSGLG